MSGIAASAVTPFQSVRATSVVRELHGTDRQQQAILPPEICWTHDFRVGLCLYADAATHTSPLDSLGDNKLAEIS
jgi:hypothetical protein